MKENVPSRLFELSQDCVIIQNYLEAWQDGRIPFKECLEALHNSLAARCVELNRKFNLGQKYLEELFKIPEPILVKFFSASISEPQKELARQEALIKGIYQNYRILKILQDMATQKIRVAPIQIIKYNDGRIEFQEHDFSNPDQ